MKKKRNLYTYLQIYIKQKKQTVQNWFNWNYFPELVVQLLKTIRLNLIELEIFAKSFNSNLKWIVEYV